MRANNFSSNVILEAALILPNTGHSSNFIRLPCAFQRPAAVVNLQQELLRYKYGTASDLQPSEHANSLKRNEFYDDMVADLRHLHSNQWYRVSGDVARAFGEPFQFP